MESIEMNDEEIIEMAKQAGFEEHQAKFDTRFEPFAKLVVEHERKKYTKLYEEEVRSIREAATQYEIPNEDAAGMLLFCEEFARMVAEKEREACAKICDDRVTAYQYATDSWAREHIGEAKHLAETIRARGQE